MTCANWDEGRDQICGHSTFSHGTYQWRPNPHHPKAELVKVSTGCTAIVDLGGDESQPCRCVRYQKPAEEEIEEEVNSDQLKAMDVAFGKIFGEKP